MADSVGTLRGPANKPLGSFCWWVLLLSLVSAMCVPALHAAQDDVAPPVAVPRFGEFRAIVIPPQTVTVPRLLGLQWREASKALSEAGLSTQEFPLFRDSPKPDNTVIDQDPAAGTKVQRGSSVTLTVSRYKAEEVLVTVPDLRGRSWDEARRILQRYGLTTQEFPVFQDSTQPSNTVIEQRPRPGLQVKRGSSVTLTVSRQTLPELQLLITGPGRIRQGETANWSARLSPDVPGASVSYRFSVGGEPITGWVRDNNVTHRFTEPGFTSVLAEAIVVLGRQRESLRAVASRVQVIPLPPPEVSIEPDSERVEQGATVRFRARVRAQMPVELLWEGPSGQRRGVDTYVVDTGEVSPGGHTITLTASAQYLESVSARARLSVDEPYSPPRASIENRTPRVAIGEPVELIGRYRTDQRYPGVLQWQWPGGQRDRADTLTMDSTPLGLGRHTFEFVVNDGREDARASTTVEVFTPLEPPLARIDPPRAEVMQGDPVVFRDVSPRANRGELVPTWLLPNGERRGGSRLELDTSDWAPDTYKVELRVDGPHGRVDTTTALLEVTRAYRPPRAAIDPPGGYRLEQGEAAVFNDASRTDGRFPVTRTWAGPAGAQEDGDTLRLDTATLEPRDYTVSLTVRDARGEDTARAPLVVLAPPPLPQLRIEPDSVSAIRGDRVDFGFSVKPPGAALHETAWSGPQGEPVHARSYAIETRDLAPGRHEIRLTARDERQRRLSAIASVQVRDPVLSLSVDRPALPPGESAVFTPRIEPELPGGRLWVRIDGVEGLQRVDETAPLTHLFPAAGSYKAVLVVERDGLRWQSAPVTVLVAVPFWQPLWPWLGALGGLAALGAGGALAWQRVRRRRPARPVSKSVRLETAVRAGPAHTVSDFGPLAPEFPEVALTLITDRGTQTVTDNEEQNREPEQPSGA